MRGVHNTGPALRLVFRPLIVRGNHKGFVVGKEDHIRPLLHERRNIPGQFHFPPVIAPDLVRLLKLAHFGMCRDTDIDSALHNLLQQVEQFSELLGHIDISLSVAKILNPGLFCLAAHLVNTELFGPVGGVYDQRFTGLRRIADLPDFLKQHRPARRLWEPGDVHMLGAPLGVDKHRIRELRCKGGFPDAFRSIDDHFLRAFNFSPCNLH